MKLLLTLDFPPEIGGIQRYLGDIVRYTYGADDRVVVGCARRPAAPPRLAAAADYVAGPLSRIDKKLSLIPLLIRYVKLTRRMPPGAVIDCGNVYAALVPWLAGAVVRRPYGVYTYGTELIGMRRGGFLRAMLAAALNKAERVYSLGAYTSGLLAGMGITRRVTVVSPRIDAAEAAVLDNVRRRAAAPPLTTAILAVGRLVPHKGHDVLIEAVRRLPASLNWRLTIVGEGPRRGELDRSSRDAGVAARVELAGQLDEAELQAHFRAAMIFVLPSVADATGAEGFGIALLEAMSHGLPIIATKCGGIPDVVGDGGLLVAPGDAGALAAAIERLANDPKLRESLAARAARRLMEHYVWH